MFRDELLTDIKKEVERVLPENEELDGDDLDSITECINEVVTNACDALDSGDDDTDEGAHADESKKDE